MASQKKALLCFLDILSLHQGGLLGGLASTTPSKSRHGSTIEALCEQTAGVMLHNLLPRAIELAFTKRDILQQEGNQEQDEEGNMRELLRKRVRKAIQWSTSRRSIMLHCVVAWFSKPIDDLWHRTCSEKNPLKIADLFRKTNPVARCLTELSLIMLEPLREGPIKIAWMHFVDGATHEDEKWLLEELLRRMVSMVTQVHSRLLHPLQCWPYRLVTLVDREQEHFETESKRRFEEFINEPACCFDEHFTHKLWLHFEQHRNELEGNDMEKFQALYVPTLSVWAHQTRLSNMAIERLLARSKKSVPDTCPNLERFLCSSFLAEWMRKHLQADGQDPRQAPSKRKLKEEGVAIPAKKTRTASLTQGANGLFTYIRHHMPSSANTASAKREEQRRSALFKKEPTSTCKMNTLILGVLLKYLHCCDLLLFP